ncbi:MAG TPA: glycosyltransferase family 9 protein [Thermoanaerobaculia bacterium]|nr:glycosyltransferase family 9 protein [Thermoanaerobaculia bacterium]
MNILLVRTSALGDVVHCLPVLRALRRHRPEARIAWVVEAAMAPLLEGHSDLDELFTVRLRPWRREPFAGTTVSGVFGFLGRLRRFRADVALDLMGNHKGGLIARLSGARQVVGLARPFRREPSSALWIGRGMIPAGRHAVDRALSLLPALGLPIEAADFGAEQILPARPGDAPADAAEVLIHPGAGWANKVYPPRQWAAVARGIAARGIRVEVAVARGEEPLAEEIVATSEGAARLRQAGDLHSLAALLRATRLLLAGDTGPLHLAHALGTSVLGVFGPTDPERHGPWGSPERAMALSLPCSFCYKRFDGPRACLLGLAPEAVADRALELL